MGGAALVGGRGAGCGHVGGGVAAGRDERLAQYIRMFDLLRFRRVGGSGGGSVHDVVHVCGQKRGQWCG